MGGRKDLPLDVKSCLPPPTHSALTVSSVVEINTGLICGCMPVLKPFLRHVFVKAQRDQSQQRLSTRPGSIWIGKYSDDQSRRNYRDFIELERGKGSNGKTSIHEIVD